MTVEREPNQGTVSVDLTTTSAHNTCIGFARIFAFITTAYICASDRALVPWESRLAEMGPSTDDAVENVSWAGGCGDVTMSKQSVVAPDRSSAHSARDQPL